MWRGFEASRIVGLGGQRRGRERRGREQEKEEKRAWWAGWATTTRVAILWVVKMPRRAILVQL